MDSQCTAMWLTGQESDIQSACRDSFAQGLQGEVKPGSLALCAEPPVLIIDVLLLGSKFTLFASSEKIDLGPSLVFPCKLTAYYGFSVEGA